MALGKTVKALREQRGWKLRDLSLRSGVPVGTIGALEVRDSVRSEYAASLARAFGVPLDWLLQLDHETPPTLPALQGQHMHLVDALEMVAHALALADPVDRAAVKAYLSGLCDAPDRADLREKIRTALEPPPSKHATLPAVESKDFQPPVPNPFVKAP